MSRPIGADGAARACLLACLLGPARDPWATSCFVFSHPFTPERTIMMLRPNTFKRALLTREPRGLLGVWASACSPQVTEMLSTVSMLSWLTIDMEHAPNTLPSVLTQLQASQAMGTIEAVVRVPVATDPVIVKRVLDIGARRATWHLNPRPLRPPHSALIHIRKSNGMLSTHVRGRHHNVPSGRDG